MRWSTRCIRGSSSTTRIVPRSRSTGEVIDSAGGAAKSPFMIPFSPESKATDLKSWTNDNFVTFSIIATGLQWVHLWRVRVGVTAGCPPGANRQGWHRDLHIGAQPKLGRVGAGRCLEGGALRALRESHRHTRPQDRPSAKHNGTFRLPTREIPVCRSRRSGSPQAFPPRSE